MKVTFIGDIHGKVDAIEKALAMDGEIVFVGDLIDSYDRSVDEHAKCFELVIQSIKDGKARCIYGNHELSYLMPQNHKCSGWNLARESVVRDFRRDIQKYFEYFIWYHNANLLVTHAGLTNSIYKQLNLRTENIEEVLSYEINRGDSPLHWIGQARGGWAKTGGIFWCDWYKEFENVDQIHQVFGHTRLKSNIPERKGTAWCVDCLDHEYNFLEWMM